MSRSLISFKIEKELDAEKTFMMMMMMTTTTTTCAFDHDNVWKLSMRMIRIGIPTSFYGHVVALCKLNLGKVKVKFWRFF